MRREGFVIVVLGSRVGVVKRCEQVKNCHRALVCKAVSIGGLF